MVVAQKCYIARQEIRRKSRQAHGDLPLLLVLVLFSVLFVESSGLPYRNGSIDYNRGAIWNKGKKDERADQNAGHHPASRFSANCTVMLGEVLRMDHKAAL
jgi:hypothetical protein